VPSHHRTLANFESQFSFISRALSGDLDKENRGLESKLRGEEQREADLRTEEEALRKELLQAHNKDQVLQQKLNREESNYASAQRDIVQTRSGLQSWHKKSDELKTKLALVKTDAAAKQSDLQRAHQQTAKAEQKQRALEQRTKQLESSIAAARKQIAGLENSGSQLKGQLKHEEHWHKDSIAKFRRFKDAEKNLIKSIEFEQ